MRLKSAPRRAWSAQASRPVRPSNIDLVRIATAIWCQLVGAVEIEGVRVNARDGAAIKDLEVIKVKALEDSEVVLVDASA